MNAAISNHILNLPTSPKERIGEIQYPTFIRAASTRQKTKTPNKNKWKSPEKVTANQ